MENTILNALDFIFKSDPKAQEAVDNGFDIARRYSDEEWLSKMVAYASACSAPSSIGEDEIRKAITIITNVAAQLLTARINEDEQDWDFSASTTRKDKMNVLLEAKVQNKLNNKRANDLKEATDLLRSRLSERKIVLPSEKALTEHLEYLNQNGFLNTGQSFNNTKVTWNACIDTIKRLNGIN